MRRIHALPVFLIACAALVNAQQPVAEVSPFPAPAGQAGPDGSIDCVVIAPPFDATAATGGDVRILTVAAVQYTTPNGTSRKWFVSRSNGTTAGFANQQVSIFDGNAVNYPVAATYRSLLVPAGGTYTSYWGLRGGEGYDYLDTVAGVPRTVTMWGDEGRNIHFMDARNEVWSGFVNLAGAAAATVRAIGARPANPLFNDQNVLVYVCDWANNIEEWAIDLNAGTAVLNSAIILNPGSTYGLTCFQRGTDWFLAAHHQTLHTCPSNGRVKITLISLNPANFGATVWSRTADDTIPGATSYPNGGIAGGIQHARVNGQPCFAALQQTNADSIGFVPYGGYGLVGPADCGPEQMTIWGAATAGFTSGMAIHGNSPGKLYIGCIGFPPAAGFPLPMAPMCVLDTSLPIPATILMPFTTTGITTKNLNIPAGIVLSLIFDSLAVDIVTSAVTSTNRVNVEICLPPF